ncbi:Peptide deformylase 1 [Corynebacterium kutscheri]|uniref:Peptide deformylase n=1 Tax=Corynebacterium kutscheri TaxID=35755 RepID=A0A0F6QZQ2_9CORY|nr:peptide deformylase [Corynebacterium kutscheri]AKE41297.1 peptide deformylase [Corynebacterium kutscheri]VEH08573.1 Peptide deformylase 1 [Corynebacterium kutscheri]VEH09619.1 Peptide deformylase 1 [Corynebacterium kutscheri]VEH79702.1 Peptide deformylase 1 [Corynebacterium kutscheri]
MTIRDIRIFGDPVLTTRAEEITIFDDSLVQLVDDMLETMDNAGGVGLAANQIGLLRRIFVFDCSHTEDGMRGHIINPVWEPIGDKMQTATEGCLSIPNIKGDVSRYETVQVTGQDMTGKTISMVCSGLMARCVQHETDHLDGQLFLRLLDSVDRKQAMSEIREASWFNA